MTGYRPRVVEEKFEVLEEPVDCPECRQKTMVVFGPERVCNRCAQVFSSIERAKRKAPLKIEEEQ